MDKFILYSLAAYAFLMFLFFLFYVYRSEVTAKVVRYSILNGKLGWLRAIYSWRDSNNYLKKKIYRGIYVFYSRHVIYHRTFTMISLRCYDVGVVNQVYQNSGLVPVKVYIEGSFGYEYYRKGLFVWYRVGDIFNQKQEDVDVSVQCAT